MSARLVSLAGAVLASALLLSGCSSDPAPNTTTPDASSTETASAEGTTEPAADDTASMQAWALGITKVEAAVTDALGTWTDSGCTATAIAMGDVTCSAQAIALGYGAQTVALSWTGLRNSDSKIYIESVPADIQTFVEATDASVADLETASAEYDATCPDGEGCAGKVLRLEMAIEDVQTTLSAWSDKL